jgi:Protein kinase domain
MHSRGLVHCDLKPENFCLVEPLGAGRPLVDNLRLIDFGLSQRVRGGQAIAGLAGSIPYMAPEIKTRMYDHKARACRRCWQLRGLVSATGQAQRRRIHGSNPRPAALAACRLYSDGAAVMRLCNSNCNALHVNLSTGRACRSTSGASASSSTRCSTAACRSTAAARRRSCRAPRRASPTSRSCTPPSATSSSGAFGIVASGLFLHALHNAAAPRRWRHRPVVLRCAALRCGCCFASLHVLWRLRRGALRVLWICGVCFACLRALDARAPSALLSALGT